MNKKKLVIYYMAVIGAFVTTQAPFWIARKATAAGQEATVVKRAPRAKAQTAAIKKTSAKATKATGAVKNVPCKMVASAHNPAKPYKAISSSVCTFDPERNVLVCQHGEGLTLELPVTLKAYSGSPLDYVARLPKSKNALCGLPVAKKGEKLDPNTPHQCGLVIDETRLSEASIVMPEKLKSLKPKQVKTTVAHSTAATVTE